MELTMELCRDRLFVAMRRHGMTDAECDIVEQQSLELAIRMHAGQTRGTGEAYITHPLSVALILVDNLGVRDVATIHVAILHDAIEDAPDSLAASREILRRFGRDLHDDIVTLSEIRGEHGYLRRIRAGNHRVQLVKFADRIHNLQNPDPRDKKRFARKKTETRRDILPIARAFIARLPADERWRGEWALETLTRLSRIKHK